MSFLELDGLRKTYDDGTEAVKGVDLLIEAGEFIVLLGPSGCGKTTTLRMIAGLETVTSGSVRMAGDDVTDLRPSQRDVGFVFQFYALYPHLSVANNIAFPLASAGVNKHERRQRVQAVAERLGLTSLLERYPGQLSGGDQQRVSLARAMVRQPRVYLMDEPLGSLDADQRLEMREFIRAQQQELGVTTVYVTHDQEEAMSLADRVVVMSGGLLQQVGAPLEVYDRPANTFVANFVGAPGMNFVDGEVRAGAFVVGDWRQELPVACADGKATLGIRPEFVQPADDGNLSAEVVADEFMGAARLVHLDTPAGRLVLRSTTAAAQTPGATLNVRLDPRHIRVFQGPDGEVVT